MATPNQAAYISDLVVQKTKEFKEVKELLVANNIVSENAEIVSSAQSLAEITNALTDQQASNFIDVLSAAKLPARSPKYAEKRVQRTIDTLAGIKDTIGEWDFS